MKSALLLFLLSAFCWAGGSAPAINSDLLKKYKDKCDLFEGTVIEVKKSYLLEGREYKITDEQLEKLKLAAYGADDPNKSTYMKIRVLHTVTLQANMVLQGSLKKNEKISFEILDHIDSMCPHFRTLPLRTAKGEPASLIWMFYFSEGEKGILRREHALASKADWAILTSKSEQDSASNPLPAE